MKHKRNNTKLKQKYAALIGSLILAIFLHVVVTGGIVEKDTTPPQVSTLQKVSGESLDVFKIIKHLEPTVFEDDEEWLTVEVTAYTAGYESTSKTPSHPLYGITASGKKVKENYTIACPPSMEFGTRIYIPYFDNTFTCQDRGSAITEGHLDVYMSDIRKAREFGRQQMEVLIKN